MYVNTFKEFEDTQEIIESTTVETVKLYDSVLQEYTEPLKYVILSS